jgi:hypothetical protein
VPGSQCNAAAILEARRFNNFVPLVGKYCFDQLFIGVPIQEKRARSNGML